MARNRQEKEEERRQRSESVKSVAKTAGLVTAGVAAFRHRGSIGSAISDLSSNASLIGSRALSRDNHISRGVSNIGTFLTGVTDSLGDNPSVRSVIRSTYNPNIQEQMRKSFEQSVRSNILKRQSTQNIAGHNRTQLGSRYYKEFHKKESGGLDKFQHLATQQYRENQVIKNLRNNEIVQRNGGEDVINALTHFGTNKKGIYYKPEDHIDDFLKKIEAGEYKAKPKYKTKEDRNAFKGALQKTLEEYQGSNAKVFDQHADKIMSAAEAMKSASSFEFIKSALESTSKLEKSLNKKGFNMAKLSDAEKWDLETKRKHGLIVDDYGEKGEAVQTDITAGLRKFLNEEKHNPQVQKLLKDKGINFNFEDIILDPLLFNNKQTGEIIDNRHLRENFKKSVDSFQESVQVPYLKINPVDLTPWQSFRSGEAKEGIQLLSAGQVHGFVRFSDNQSFNTAAKSVHEKAIRKPLNNSNNFYTGGSIYNVDENGNLSLIDENLYLTSSKYGPFSRMHKNMTNYTEHDTPDDRGFLKKLFDLGNQEGDSHLTTYKKAYKKLDDPSYGPNVLSSLVNEMNFVSGEESVDLIRNAYGILRTGIDRNTTELSSKSASVLAPHVNKLFKEIEIQGKPFDFNRISEDDYLKEAAVKISSNLENNVTNLELHNVSARSRVNHLTGEREVITKEDSSVSQLKRWTKQYMQDPETFDKDRSLAIEKNLPGIMEFVVPLLGEDDKFITNTQKLRRSFHQYALRALDAEMGDLAKETVENGVRRRSSLGYLIDAKNKKVLNNEDVKNAKDLELLTDLYEYSGIHNNETRVSEAKTFLTDLLRVNGKAVSYDENKVMYDGPIHFTGLGQDLTEGINRAQPKFGRAPEPKKDNLHGSDILIMRKGSVKSNAKETLSKINLGYLSDPVESPWDYGINAERFVRDAAPKAYETGKEIVQEMFAGRRKNTDSLDKVTTTTGVIYGLSERLDNQFKNFGLGLSREHMGSFQSILGNQYLRRIVLPLVAYEQLNYFDSLTGDAISDTAADTYVNTHTTLAKIKDMLGINKALKPWKEVFMNAGADQVGEWVGVKQFNFLTMGAFSDFRTEEELTDFYESGEVAIRKNRYWGIGSPTPWAGSGIEYYRPNWYRSIKSDYKMTDTMYGSKSEYYANHWMPTLTHPFAPIKHFLTDTKHYEKKHEDDRPYAITGGFSEIQNIPIVGPVIDGTVGRILKPREEHKGLEKAHREYIAAINDHIAHEQSPLTEEGSYIGVNQSGEVEQYNKYGSTGSWGGITPIDVINGRTGSGPTYGADVGRVNKGNMFATKYVAAGASGSGKYNDYEGHMGSGNGSGYGSGYGMGGSSGADDIRDTIALENYELAQDGKGRTLRSVSGLQRMNNRLITEDVDSMERVDSLKGSTLDAFYSASELTGIYGFLTKTGMDYDESWRGTTLATSNLMTSPNRAFWDMDLGGLGGALSEIGRRYAPRDPNKNYYSPIRNTMPDWLPGIEGNIDFLHGDPYVKIKKGEMRLPGDAYESLYKLHPDETGRYGIFDRFRILADIDPDSEQYKIAKHEVSLLRQSGRMTDEMEKEYDEIIDQVRSKEDTIRWYDKKFSYADIKRESVTITNIVDANTFMVKEFDAPIRLAGVKLTKKDNQDVIDWLGQYIKVGEKVDIGISKDSASRYNNDTYGTMSAVVYANKNEEGRMWFETNKGKALNQIIANRKWQNPVTIKDNGSATATQALYSNDMITVGKYMEMLTHDILPQIPFVGTIADKFLQVRTPIESYKRDQVYGSDWRPWTDPYSGWIKPMVNTVATRNPLVAGAEMAAIGHMFGKTKKAKGVGRVAGAAIGAGLSSLRVFKEGAEDILPGADGVWIPKERRKEREVNEYFDRLKYVKYKGLYEEASRLAASKEGVDVNDFFDDAAEKGRKNKGLKRFLTERKKLLSLSKKIGYGDEVAVQSGIDDLKESIENIDSDKEAYEAGKYTSLAIKYRKEYESTLYAMDSASDRTALMRALTQKEREYVPRFLETSNSKERQEILKYVPKDIKRILQTSWGMKADKKENIESYFKDHYLPDKNWSGWKASSNLDDIKIKVMKKEGVNPTTAGLWQKDQARAERQGEKAIPIHSLSSKIDLNRLRKVLSGAGLSDVDVQLTTSYGEGQGGINTGINIMKDVKGQILDVINEGIGTII